MLPSFPAFLQKIHDKYKCNKIIAIGDIADFHSMSYHEPEPNLKSVDDEITATRHQLSKITSRFPKVEYLMGNHCSLIERKAVTAGLSSCLVKPINDVLGLPKGWKTYANERSRIFGCATGCGIDREALQFSYGTKFTSKPIISCAVILDNGRLPIVEPMYL
jgi:hypothetical protein